MLSVLSVIAAMRHFSVVGGKRWKPVETGGKRWKTVETGGKPRKGDEVTDENALAPGSAVPFTSRKGTSTGAPAPATLSGRR